MGPYCKFCGDRCFVPVPTETPAAYLEIMRAQGLSGLILATCRAGKALDRQKLGYDIDTLTTKRGVR